MVGGLCPPHRGPVVLLVGFLYIGAQVFKLDLLNEERDHKLDVFGVGVCIDSLGLQIL